MNPTSILGGVLAVVVVAFLAAVYLVWDARRLATPTHGRLLPAPCHRRRPSSPASSRFVGIFVLRADATYLFDGLTSRALPLVICSRALRRRRPCVLLLRDATRGARLLAVGAVASVVVGWGVAQWDYMLPDQLTVVDGRGALRHAHRGPRRDRARGAFIVLPASSCSTSSTNAACCPRKPPRQARPGDRGGRGSRPAGNVWAWTRGHVRFPPARADRPTVLCADSYCTRYRHAARHPQPLDTGLSKIGFRGVARTERPDRGR